jgi:acyl-CoA thioesterase-1
VNENGILIDDLYAFALPRMTEIQKPANVHFTDSGSGLVADRVARSILAALEQRGAEKLGRQNP